MVLTTAGKDRRAAVATSTAGMPWLLRDLRRTDADADSGSSGSSTSSSSSSTGSTESRRQPLAPVALEAPVLE